MFSRSEFNSKIMPVLKEVYEDQVTLESAHDRREILHSLLEEFRKYMKYQDPLFNLLFQKYLYTGSAFEGLQVKEVDEFDIDIMLKFPQDFEDNLMLVEDPDLGLYGTYKLSYPFSYVISMMRNRNALVRLAQFFDGEGFLINENVRSWCQSLVDQFRIGVDKQLVQLRGVRKVESTSSGPARTLKIRLTSDPINWISVDLVPVFAIKTPRLRKIIYHDDIVRSDMMRECILVPKPLRNSYKYYVQPDRVQKLWRLHFPDAENEIMYNTGCLKPLIKLVKCLRDKEGFPIASYFIKVVAFWMVKENRSPNYFHDQNMGIRFLDMLEAMLEYVDERKLPHIFYENFNLFERLSDTNLKQIGDRLRKIIAELKRDPYSVRAFFRATRYRN